LQPERISGKEYTIRSDVWSTGITLLELVQKRFPFPNDVPPIELIMYITQGEVRIIFFTFPISFIGPLDSDGTCLLAYLATATRR
jgi:serine/threonine protein kinase